ncbi:hypothetical protein SAMN05880580_12112 [Priestia flexa]|nr:hypothetical protein SAMN05880580_12112 [Priestia flexa]
MFQMMFMILGESNKKRIDLVCAKSLYKGLINEEYLKNLIIKL